MRKGKSGKVQESWRSRFLRLSVAVMAVVLSGGVVLAAVNVFSSLQIESGGRSGNATIITDATAAGSAAVKFGTNSVEAALCEGMDRWSQASTWSGGNVPTVNASVVLPADKQIQVDVDVPHLSNVTVPTGTTLCFPDRATTFSATQIVVNGKLQAGTATKRLTSNVTFKLEGGDASGSFIPTGFASTTIANYNSTNGGLCSSLGGCINIGQGNIGTNFMTAFNGGQIEIYGRETGRTWTDLANTSNAGSNTLQLRDAVSWQAGDSIVIASSAFDWRQQERKTVQTVSGDGKTITLTTPLAYRHSGIQTCETLGLETRCVHERAEVGLLSHNIKITGSSDATTTQYSGHVIVLPGGRINVANAEFYNLGQKGKIARYPLHFHILGNDGTNSSVSNISLHDNFNRQIDIHGTNNLQISGIVAANTLGHSIMFEDGIEQNNTLTGNLVMGSTRNPVATERVRPSEEIPSNYWLGHPNNNLIGNHAAGSDGIGIWHDLPPIDNFNGWAAMSAAWGNFDDNVSHSNVIPAGQSNVSAPHDRGNGFFVSEYQQGATRKVAYRNSGWKNEGFNFWVDGAVTFADSTGANSCVSVTMQNSYMRGGIHAGETDNTAGDSGFNFGHGCGLLRQYHGGADYDDIWLTHYGGTAKTEFGSGITDGGVGISDHTTRIRNLKFFGSGYKTFFEACKFDNGGTTEYGICYYGLNHGGNSHVMYDLDGSIRGDGQPIAITNSSPFMRYGQNFLYKDISPYPYWNEASRGLVTPVGYKYLALTPLIGYDDNTVTRTSDGTSSANGGWTMVRTGDRYAVTTMRSWQLEGSYTGWVEFVMDMAQQPQNIQRSYYASFGNAKNQQKASSLANLGVDGNWWWANGKLYVRSTVGGTDLPFGRAGERDDFLNFGDGMFWRVIQ